MQKSTDYNPCRSNSQSSDSCNSVLRRSSKVRPASENNRSLDVLVAGTPSSKRAMVASLGRENCLTFQNCSTLVTTSPDVVLRYACTSSAVVPLLGGVLEFSQPTGVSSQYQKALKQVSHLLQYIVMYLRKRMQQVSVCLCIRCKCSQLRFIVVY